MFTLLATNSQRFQTYSVQNLCLSKKKIMLPAFFDLKLRKGDTLENETIELFVRLRTSRLSFSFMSQTEFTTFEKFLIDREVPPSFKCNLLLLRGK